MAFPGIQVNARTGNWLDLLRATREYIEKNVEPTFGLQSYPLLEFFLPRRKSISASGDRYEWNVRLRDGSGGGATRMYAPATWIRSEGTARANCSLIIDSVTMLWDTAEWDRNMGPNKVFDLYVERWQMELAAMATRWENWLLGTPNSQEDDLNPRGLLYQVRPTVAGTANPNGGYEGTTARMGDGTDSSVWNGLDAAALPNQRLRNWNFTHDGTFSPLLRRQLIRAMNRSEWRAPTALPGVKGMPTRGERLLFMSQPLHDDWTDYVNSGPDDHQGNLMRFQGRLPFGTNCRIVPTPVLNNQARNPIIGVDLDDFEVGVLGGRFLKPEGEAPDSGNLRVIKQQWTTQFVLRSKNPRHHFIGTTVS